MIGVVRISTSGATEPKYGCFWPFDLAIECATRPYEAGASPSSNIMNPSIDPCCPDEKIYIPIFLALRVITNGVENPEERWVDTGPKICVPKPSTWYLPSAAFIAITVSDVTVVLKKPAALSALNGSNAFFPEPLIVYSTPSCPLCPCPAEASVLLS